MLFCDTSQVGVAAHSEITFFFRIRSFCSMQKKRAPRCSVPRMKKAVAWSRETGSHANGLSSSTTGAMRPTGYCSVLFDQAPFAGEVLLGVLSQISLSYVQYL